MASLKISPDQLQRIKQARIERGWAIDRPEWLIEASKILKPTMNWERDEKLAVSIGSWKRFLHGKPIKPAAFKAFCQVLGLNWQEAVGSMPLTRAGTANYDWGEAPDPSIMVGRSVEVATLKQWIVCDRVRLVSILGVGGIGKTSLASKVAREIAGEFEYVIWRSLCEAPAVEQLVGELIQLFAATTAIDLPVTLGQKITLLLDLFQASRCLVILDSVESILQSGSLTGTYHLHHHGYREFFRRIGTSVHQSCLLVTGREPVREMRRLQGPASLVRVMKLAGLQQEAAKILNVRGVFGSALELEALITKYHGNPLALEIVSTTIKDIFNNDIADFLQVPGVFGEIKDLLAAQSHRLSEVEKMMICWLANYPGPATCHKIAADLPGEAHGTIIEALDSLLDRSLIQSTEHGFILQNIVMEYVKDSAASYRNLGAVDLASTLN